MFQSFADPCARFLLARVRNSLELPDTLARAGAVRRNETADAFIATRNTRNHHITGNQGRRCCAIVLTRIRHLYVPH